MKVHIVDTTLRDGEQTAGVVFSAEEKVEIAKILHQVGVSAIEAGIPAMGRDEQEALRSVLCVGLPIPVVSWNRASLMDIHTAVLCGFSHVHISVPVSDLHIRYKLKKSREWVLEQLAECIAYARSFGCTVYAGAEDASRAEDEFFLQIAEIAAGKGAERIRFADTVGCLEPFGTYERMNSLVKRCALPIEIHLHNDFGLASANMVSAVKAGVEWVSVTVGGIGERAGNTSLEDTVKILDSLREYDTGICKSLLPPLTDLVKDACHSPADLIKKIS